MDMQRIIIAAAGMSVWKNELSWEFFGLVLFEVKFLNNLEEPATNA